MVDENDRLEPLEPEELLAEEPVAEESLTEEPAAERPAEQPAAEESPAEEPAVTEIPAQAQSAQEDADAQSAEGPAPETTPSEELDDLTVAIAEADANFEGSVTEDSASEPVSTALPPADDLAVPVAHSVSWIPFVVYDLLWLAFAGVLIWQFMELPKTQAIYDSRLYPLAVFGGVAFAIVGPLLIVAVWIASWGRDGARKGPLFVSSLLRGAVATLVGVILWWAALVLLDQLRLGRLL